MDLWFSPICLVEAFPCVSAGSHRLRVPASLPEDGRDEAVPRAAGELQPEGPRHLPGWERLLHPDHPLLHAQS